MTNNLTEKIVEKLSPLLPLSIKEKSELARLAIGEMYRDDQFVQKALALYGAKIVLDNYFSHRKKVQVS